MTGNSPRYISLFQYAVFLSILYAVGIAGHIIQALRPLMLSITPYFLFITGLGALFPVLVKNNRAFYIWGALVFIITFILEAAGTATGLVFGPYTYGPTLGPHFLGVPPVIAMNWVLVILGIIYLLEYMNVPPAILPVLAGICAFIFDFFMEPVAIEFDYWNWTGGAIPIRNYIAWTLIAAGSAFSYTKIKTGQKSLFPVILLANQTAFFLILRIIQLARYIDA